MKRFRDYSFRKFMWNPANLWKILQNQVKSCNVMWNPAKSCAILQNHESRIESCFMWKPASCKIVHWSFHRTFWWGSLKLAASSYILKLTRKPWTLPKVNVTETECWMLKLCASPCRCRCCSLHVSIHFPILTGADAPHRKIINNSGLAVATL